MALVGLERSGAPIRVIIAPEDGDLARQTPPWVAGFADGGSGVVVLFPQRSMPYPYTSLEELVAHEVAHVLVWRAARGRALPRWFNEGLAMVAGGAWGAQDRARLSLALIVQGDPSLELVERAFESRSAGAVHRAYALAGAFVRWLFQRHGTEVAARILEAVRGGLPFEQAFERATSSSLAAEESAFWRHHALWYRWVPILTSSLTLWLFVTLLALWAFRRRSVRNAAIRERWEREDERAGH